MRSSTLIYSAGTLSPLSNREAARCTAALFDIHILVQVEFVKSGKGFNMSKVILESESKTPQNNSQEYGGALLRLFEILIANPAGSLFALLSLFSSLAKTVAALDLEPIIADALTLCLSVIAAVLWIRSLYFNLHKPALARVLDAAGQPAPIRRQSALALRTTLAVLPLVLAFWTCRPLFQWSIGHEPWIFCGTVNASCSNVCVKLLDSEGRPLSNCLVAHDGTGYIEVRRVHWYDYRPHSLSVSCPGLPTKNLAIPMAMKSPFCGGVLEIQ